MTLTIQNPFSALFLVVLVLALFRPITTAGATTGKYLVYVGTYTDHGGKGIYAYRFDARTGQPTSLGLAVESAEPVFFTIDASGHFLYAINEIANYEGQPTGAVSAYAIDSASGRLSLLNQVSSRNAGPAHITLDHAGKCALVSNYPRGSVAVFPVLKDGRLGEVSALVQHRGPGGVDKERQEGPHAHAVALSPDNRFALVADLGLDQLFAYPS
jgi:6-phosphogluconolactonase